ncbi:MAG TPA: lysophospholipid acyltransferase family protein [Egibacteraceae bacterium]|nr:lysophospholipid acyltransferase family protein [Egibacteraceae bacterium]
MEPAYAILVHLSKFVMALMGWKSHVEGADKIPAAGPALLSCNHISFLDPIQLGVAAYDRGRCVRYLGKRELWDQRVLGFFARRTRQIPVDRTRTPGAALAGGVRALKDGEVVGVFPEGTISTTFSLRKAKLGTARMALATGVPLIPCAVWGGQRIATRARKWTARRGVALSLVVGEPIPYSVDEDPAEVTDRLMAAIAALVDRAMREYPQAPAGEGDRWWLPRPDDSNAADSD